MRHWLEIVKPWPPFTTGQFYEAEVVSIRKARRQMEVTVRVLKHMPGRTVPMVLALPIRPEGSTAEFFTACDIRVSPGAQIRPQDTVGRKLLIQFGQTKDGIAALSFKACIAKEP